MPSCECRGEVVGEGQSIFDCSLKARIRTQMHLIANTISQPGYKCELLVLIFGSLRHFQRLVKTGLQVAGIPKEKG